MKTQIISTLEDVAASDWNALSDPRNPFTRHEFLVALERHGCVGEKHGWYPQHLLAYEDNRLVGAVPMYLKDNSYGELVFDWDWAEAYQRHGINYYPKLVVAIPYTPATGQRLLIAPGVDRESIANTLITAAQSHAEQLNVSSLHWLFPDQSDTQRLKQQGLMIRLGYQFHWENHDYRDFADFLSTFTAHKRKKIKRERRRVQEQGVELEILNGHEISAAQWEIFYHFYEGVFDQKYGYATLSQGFFQEIGQTMADNVVLVLAKHQGRYVAGAFNMRGSDTLYGRNWGCSENYHSLHFEACYYQGLEYCIEQGLKRFDPGAQGEHKISRGFLPTPTWSAHWIAQNEFRRAIQDFLTRETYGMEHYIQSLQAHSPFKQSQVA